VGPSRLTRRRFLTLAGVSSSIALLAACGQAPSAVAPATSAPAPAAPAPATAVPAAAPATSPTSAPAAAAPTAPTAPGAAGAPRRGGTLLVAEQNDTQTFDPHRSTGGSPAYGLVYNCLVNWRVQPDGSIKAEPDLATSWQLDDTTATFKLRQGVTFHDGSDWNAEVAKFNLERMNDAKSQARAFVSGITSVEVVDPYTLKLNLVSPQGSLLSNLSQAADGRPYMISKVLADKAGDNYGTSPDTTAGTGSMKLVEWVSGSSHTVQRTGTYFEQGTDGQALPYFDSLKVRFIADDAVRLTELRSGNVHIIDNIQAKDVPVASKDPTLDNVENTYQKSCYQFTFSTKSPKFADLKLRQAVHYAIDRATVAKVLGQGIGEPEYWFLTPGYLGYDESVPHYAYDLAKAKQLVADAGFPDGVDVNLLIINRAVDQQEAQVLKQMLDEAGIRTTIEVLERLAWLARVQTLDYELGIYFTGLRPDPDSILAGRFQTGEGKNQAGMSDPTMDELLAKGRGSYDDTVRAAAYKDVQTRIYDTAWYGTIWMKQYFDGFSKSVQGRVPVQGGFDLQHVWLTG
jgi:peptide/nickel transport system substrate-binding protein